MADVPIATQVFGFNPTISKGPDLSWIGQLPDAYWAGGEQAFKQRNQDLFQAGLPRDANGNIDWNKASEEMLRAGGAGAVPQAVALQNFDTERRALEQEQEMERQRQGTNAGNTGYLQPPRTQLPPSSSGPAATGTAAAPPAAVPPGPTFTIRQLAGTQYNPDDLAATMSQQGVQVTPDTPLPRSPQAIAMVRNAVAGAQPIARVNGAFQAVQDAQPQQSAQVPNAQVAQAPSAAVTPYAIPPERIQAIQNEMQAKTDEANHYFGLAAAFGIGKSPAAEDYKARGEAAARRAQALQESLQRILEPTNEMKTGAAAGYANPIDYERQKAVTAANVAQETKQYENITKNYDVAQTGLYRLGLIDESIKTLGPQWMGTGANFRANAAKTYNSFRDLLPAPVRNETPQFDPKKIAGWEDFNKQTMNLGFELARTLGSREAQQIVKQATSSVPGALQTFWGARLVSASMNQAFQRSMDYREFVDTLPPGQRLKADVAFNKAHPVGEYVAKATSVVPPQPAIDALRARPDLRSQFDAKYGDGASIGVFGAR